MSQIRSIEKTQVVLSPIAHIQEPNDLEEAKKEIVSLKNELLMQAEFNYSQAKCKTDMDVIIEETVNEKEFDQNVDQSFHHQDYSIREAEAIATELHCPEFSSESYGDWILKMIKNTVPKPSKLLKSFKIAQKSMSTSNRAQDTVVSIIIKTLKFDIDYLGDRTISSGCNYLDVLNFVKESTQDHVACKELITKLLSSLIDKIEGVLFDSRADKYKTEILECYINKRRRQLEVINQPKYLLQMS